MNKKNAVISFKGVLYYKMYVPIFPFKLDGKWYLWRKIKETYKVGLGGQSILIKTELVD